MERVGLLQRRVYALVGLYPWRCATCGKRTLAFSRREPAGSQPAPLAHPPPVAKQTSGSTPPAVPLKPDAQ